MHRAPAVIFTVKRSRWQVRLIACLAMLALVTMVVFASGQTTQDHRTAVLALAIVIASSVALWGWKNAPQGSLRWDGQHWYWSGFRESPACSLGLLMDFQRVVVVSIHAKAKAPIFLWLEANPGDPSWPSLRRAIVSSLPAGAGKNKEDRPGVVGDPA